jgi:hypothetical protein
MGRSGVAMLSIVVLAMEMFVRTSAATAGEKTVLIREYLRFRYGKWETVISHFRRPPSH